MSLLIVITTNSIYVNTGDSNKLIPILALVVIIATVLELISSKINYNYFKTILTIVLIYLVVCITNIFISFNSLSINEILFYFVIAPLMLILLMFKNFNDQLFDFLNTFVKIILIFAIVSLIFWTFGSILKVVYPTNVVINNWSGGLPTPSYFNLYFETQGTHFFGTSIIRNSGMFAEAPMWSLMLSSALIIQELFLENSIKRLSLLTLTILTTVSTTGIFVIGLLLIYRVLMLKKPLLKYISLITIPIVIYALLQVWEEKSDSISASIRFDDYIAGFLAWRANFFFGSGLTLGLKAIESNMNTLIRTNLGYSNSLFVILAQGGVILGIFYLYPVISVLIKKGVSIATKMFALLFIILLFTAIFIDTPLFILFIGIFYALILNREST
jgi:putative membrane protein